MPITLSKNAGEMLKIENWGGLRHKSQSVGANTKQSSIPAWVSHHSPEEKWALSVQLVLRAVPSAHCPSQQL